VFALLLTNINEELEKTEWERKIYSSCDENGVMEEKVPGCVYAQNKSDTAG